MPPGGQRPARVSVVIELLTRHLADAPWAHVLPPALDASVIVP
jgi:hypothetical protein